MFVHLVKEGLAESPEAELLAHHYLDSHPAIDTLILGCTHYPVLRDVIQRAVGDSVELVSSADVAADMLRQTLGHTGAPEGGEPVTLLFGSHSAKLLFRLSHAGLESHEAMLCSGAVCGWGAFRLACLDRLAQNDPA
jgi:glutamate racemase